MVEKDTVDQLADMRRKLEDRKSANRSAIFFTSFCYMVGFILLMYIGQMQILSYISIFVVLIFILMYSNFKQSKRDIEAIDGLCLGFECLKNKK